MLFDEIISKDPIVVKGIITKMLNSSTNSSKLILGIDPGQRIGVSVTYLENEIARAFFVSLDKLIHYLISILAELPAARKIIKIGNINNIYCLEAPLYSDMLSVAGTVDCVAEYNGKLSVIDFKTSKKTKKEEWIDDYFIQAFFYAAAFFEMTGAIPEQIIILIAIRDSFEVQVFKKPLQDMEIYIDKLITIMKKNPTVIQQT